MHPKTTHPPDATTVAYDVIGSPFGPFLAAATQRGVCLLSFDADPEVGADEVSEVLGVEARRYPEELLELRYELAEYFDGERRTFDVPVDLRLATPFARRVLAETAQIAYGHTRTYGEIADAIGEPKAARAVGQALNRNPVAVVVPCHRVVGGDGSLTGYGGGLDRKLRLLTLEGSVHVG